MTDPIYKAHSYQTKVPHWVIVPSILHYAKPGNIVLDGFAGSGMTGVAAQWCGTAPAATFIAANYNPPFDVEDFAQAGEQLLKLVEQGIGWMYETLHTDGKTKGRVEYTVGKTRYEKKPSSDDLAVLQRIESLSLPAAEKSALKREFCKRLQ